MCAMESLASSVGVGAFSLLLLFLILRFRPRFTHKHAALPPVPGTHVYIKICISTHSFMFIWTYKNWHACNYIFVIDMSMNE